MLSLKIRICIDVLELNRLLLRIDTNFSATNIFTYTYCGTIYLKRHVKAVPEPKQNLAETTLSNNIITDIVVYSSYSKELKYGAIRFSAKCLNNICTALSLTKYQHKYHHCQKESVLGHYPRHMLSNIFSVYFYC